MTRHLRSPFASVRALTLVPLFLIKLAGAVDPAAPAELSDFCADRTAVERVYHDHRLGVKAPFEQAMPASKIELLVRHDCHQVSALERIYGVSITPAMIEAEVRRIESATRAPDLLREIKRALGDDPGRFARIVVEPIIVERELRKRFQNDPVIHAGVRSIAMEVRDRLLATRGLAPIDALLAEAEGSEIVEATWQPTSRPMEVEESETSRAPGTTSVFTRETPGQPGASAQFARDSRERADAKPHFDDIYPELRTVLKAQLQKAGDVSAVIETPREYLVFMVREKGQATMRVVAVSLPKIDFEGWLAGLLGDRL